MGAAHSRPEHPPAATSRRSLQACIASLPLRSSLMSKTYLKSDHFNGGGLRQRGPDLRKSMPAFMRGSHNIKPNVDVPHVTSGTNSP
jgi:hypothetical protein